MFSKNLPKKKKAKTNKKFLIKSQKKPIRYNTLIQKATICKTKTHVLANSWRKTPTLNVAVGTTRRQDTVILLQNGILFEIWIIIVIGILAALSNPTTLNELINEIFNTPDIVDPKVLETPLGWSEFQSILEAFLKDIPPSEMCDVKKLDLFLTQINGKSGRDEWVYLYAKFKDKEELIRFVNLYLKYIWMTI